MDPRPCGCTRGLAAGRALYIATPTSNRRSGSCWRHANDGPKPDCRSAVAPHCRTCGTVAAGALTSVELDTDTMFTESHVQVAEDPAVTLLVAEAAGPLNQTLLV